MRAVGLPLIVTGCRAALPGMPPSVSRFFGLGSADYGPGFKIVKILSFSETEFLMREFKDMELSAGSK
jgi:hypothetical protein